MADQDPQESKGLLDPRNIVTAVAIAVLLGIGGAIVKVSGVGLGWAVAFGIWLLALVLLVDWWVRHGRPRFRWFIGWGGVALLLAIAAVVVSDDDESGLMLRVSNVDDKAVVEVNGDEKGSVGYQGKGDFDLGDLGREDQIDVSVINDKSGCAWKFILRREGKVIFRDEDGTAGSTSALLCTGRTGTVYTVSLNGDGRVLSCRRAGEMDPSLCRRRLELQQGRGKEEPAPGARTVTIYNKVTSGLQMTEDPKPLRLFFSPKLCTTRGCVLQGVELRTGNKIDVVCQTEGQKTTNGDNTTRADDKNPQLVKNDPIWYGVRTTAGRLVYFSEVWAHPRDRGGLGLTDCSSVVAEP
jgi:hypothetical protein